MMASNKTFSYHRVGFAGKIYIVFFLFSFIFGDSFLQLDIGLGLNPFYIFVFFSLLHFFINLYNRKINFLNEKISKVAIIFFFWVMIYVLLSFLDVQRILELDGVSIDKKYIFRQGYWVCLIPCAFDIIAEWKKISFSSLKKYSKFFLILLVLIVILWKANFTIPFLEFDHATLNFFIPLLAMLLYYLNDDFRYVLLYLVTIIITFPGMATYIMGDILIFAVILVDYIVRKRKMISSKALYNFICILLPVFIISALVVLFLLSNSDPNTGWRLSYWKNEFEILLNNFLFGVGFGTGYGSTDLLHSINNPNVFLEQDPFEISSLYIAQHNSFMNIFYRVGLIGLLIFIYFILLFAKKYFKSNITSFTSFGFTFFLYGVLIIFFNPGLESPRFCISFLIGIVLFSIALLQSKTDKRDGLYSRSIIYETYGK